MSATLHRQFTWTHDGRHDNRPIAGLHIAEDGLCSAENPAGWLWALPEFAGNTLQEKAFAYADRSIGVMQNMGAGSMVVWDPEGMQFAELGYIGCPDLAVALNPELTTLFLHQFFHRYIAAGFSVGCCLRAMELNRITRRLEAPVDPFACYLRKARYAHKNFGCTVFYCDTNMWANGELLPSTVFAQLHKAMPDCQWIVEHTKMPGSVHSDPSYSQWAIDYLALENGETGTSQEVLDVVPDAFGVIEVNAGDIDGNRDKLMASVRAGHKLLVNGWADSDQARKVGEMMREAGDSTSLSKVPI